MQRFSSANLPAVFRDFQNTGVTATAGVGIRMQHIIWGLLVFVVVKSLPEADPDVQQSQAAAKTTEEATGDEGAEVGKHEQQRVVSPFRGPRQDDKQHSSDRTDQDKQKDGNTVQPELNASVFL